VAKKQKVCGGCRRVMLPAWTKCLFCGWAPVARLEFILGPLASQSLPLTEEVTTLGSVAGNTVVLADPAVSRKHVGIRRIDSMYELADLGSTNGVYINGHKVPKKTLEPGDVIRIGNTEAVFRRE
jgi:pSer/pThr/pTyr-binding forkhead associated (FHA) protein